MLALVQVMLSAHREEHTDREPFHDSERAR
jgi:hypothetical protein